jgi:hypothetical protein
MALFRYSVWTSACEENNESGTIVAASEEEAKRKLRALKFDHIHIRRVDGLKALIGQFTASIK